MPEAIGPEFVEFQAALVGRYALERELGRGGMGIVYLAREIALEREVAVKLLPPLFAAQPAHRERFLREARIAAQLSHPHIVPIFAVQELGPWVFYSMAFVEGETVAERVRRNGPLGSPAAARILREVSWALGYAHQRGVVHRDVKPENILLEAPTGRALVTDFGIAHLAALPGVTAAGQVVGTPEFMSPEQASGETPQGSSDLYSLGAVGYFMLTGRAPFEGPSPGAVLAMHLSATPGSVREVAPHTPPELAEVIARCLCKQSGQRFASGEQLAEALGASLPAQPRLPPVVARWRFLPDEVTLAQTAAVPVLIAPLVFLADYALNHQLDWSFGAALGLVFVVPFVILLIRRFDLLRRALKQGYGIRDLQAALDSPTIPDEASSLGATALARTTHAWAHTLSGLVPVGLVLLWWLVSDRIPRWNEHLYAGYTVAFGLGSLAEFWYRATHSGRTLSSAARHWFWRSWLGRVWMGLATLGARRDGRVPAPRHAATELALGSAAQVLYQSLPREERRRLGRLPALIDRLEELGLGLRRRLVELDGLASRVPSVAGGSSGSAVGAFQQRRDEAAAEITARREGVQSQLGRVVSTLEGLRLGLLRLRAGSVSVISLARDLDDAAEVVRRVESKDRPF
jgi:serine/threonine-protein kinase